MTTDAASRLACKSGGPWPRNLRRAIHLQREIHIYEGFDEYLCVEQTDADGDKMTIQIRPENVDALIEGLRSLKRMVGR